jgi:hypothetical protein
MPEPLTIGALTATALAMAGEAGLKEAVSNVVKDAYKALKAKLSPEAQSKLDALEKAPSSKDRLSDLAEAVDRSVSDQVALRHLSRQLVTALKADATVGLDIRRLEAVEVELGTVKVTEGVGARIDEAHVQGKFKIDRIEVGTPGKP